MIKYVVGDVVKITKSNKIGVVCESRINQGRPTYGVGGIWWFKQDDLELVNRATEETYMEALEILEPDEDI